MMFDAGELLSRASEDGRGDMGTRPVLAMSSALFNLVFGLDFEYGSLGFFAFAVAGATFLTTLNAILEFGMFSFFEVDCWAFFEAALVALTVVAFAGLLGALTLLLLAAVVFVAIVGVESEVLETADTSFFACMRGLATGVGRNCFPLGL